MSKRIEGQLRVWLTLAVALFGLGMVGGSHAAQVNETDRLARCVNNRVRLAELEGQLAADPWRGSSLHEDALSLLRRRERDLAELDTVAPILGAPEMTDRITESLGYDLRSVVDRFGVPQCGAFLARTNPNDAPRFAGNPSEALRCAVNGLRAKLVEVEARRPVWAQMETQIAEHRNNLVALNCGGASPAQVAASPQAQAWMTGTFDSTYGLMTLSPGGGTYDYYGGTIRVARIVGNVMEGTWTQTRSAEQCMNGTFSGKFKFTFSERSFSGAYGYCDDEPNEGWTGRRK